MYLPPLFLNELFTAEEMLFAPSSVGGNWDPTPHFCPEPPILF